MRDELSTPERLVPLHATVDPSSNANDWNADDVLQNLFFHSTSNPIQYYRGKLSEISVLICVNGDVV